MQGRLDRKELAKYPFLKEAQEWVSGRTGSLAEFFSSNYGRIAARHAVERIQDAMEGGRPPAPYPERLDPDREVYAYAIARVLASCTRDRLLMDRLARFEAERASRYLADESPEKRALVAEGVGMPAEAADLPVVQYVELASHLKDMGKVMARAPQVEIALGIDHPVKFSFPIAEGAGRVEYLLAPRIEAE